MLVAVRGGFLLPRGCKPGGRARPSSSLKGQLGVWLGPVALVPSRAREG
jgi:hypothetical protein